MIYVKLILEPNIKIPNAKVNKTKGLQLWPVSDFSFSILQLFRLTPEGKGQLKITTKFPEIVLKEAEYLISES